jgi:IMP cyclohydrolase
MEFEYRKFGSLYWVSIRHSFDFEHDDYKTDFIGRVEKQKTKWFGFVKNGAVVEGKTRKEASEKMAEAMKAEKMECMICGNKELLEIEKIVLYSDGAGKGIEEIQTLCKEGKGCSE